MKLETQGYTIQSSHQPTCRQSSDGRSRRDIVRVNFEDRKREYISEHAESAHEEEGHPTSCLRMICYSKQGKITNRKEEDDGDKLFVVETTEARRAAMVFGIVKGGQSGSTCLKRHDQSRLILTFDQTVGSLIFS